MFFAIQMALASKNQVYIFFHLSITECLSRETLSDFSLLLSRFSAISDSSSISTLIWIGRASVTDLFSDCSAVTVGFCKKNYKNYFPLKLIEIASKFMLKQP